MERSSFPARTSAPIPGHCTSLGARSLPLANPPQTALIYSPDSGVFDVVSVCFSLRRGRVIASGARDAFDVATAVADDANTCSLSVGSDERPTGGDAGQ